MRNFELCDGLSSALQKRLQTRLDHLNRETADPAHDVHRDSGRVAADFASVLYTQALKQMQKSIKSQEGESPLGGGVRDFMTMLLPQALSRSSGDPVAAYIQGVLDAQEGDPDAGNR